MDDTVLQTYVVTTEPPSVAGRNTDLKRWVVLALDSETACDIVRERVAPESTVAITDESLPDDVIATFGLKPGHAVAF